MTSNARRFKNANDKSPVVDGKVLNLETGGGRYVLEDGTSYILSSQDCLSLPDGYPKWKL